MLDTISTFTAHADDSLGVGALEILKGFGCKTELLTGPDPIGQPRCVAVFSVAGRKDSLGNRVMRVREADAPERDHLEPIPTPAWAKDAKKFVILNAERIKGDMTSEGVRAAIITLCGYKAPKKAKGSGLDERYIC